MPGGGAGPTYLAIFALVALAVVLARMGLARTTGRGRQVSARYAALLHADAPAPVGDLRKRSGASHSRLRQRLDRLVTQSGTGVSHVRLATLFVGLALGIFVSCGFINPGLLRLAVSALVSGALLYGYLRAKRARRMKRFGEQLPEVIDVIVRSLRAGHPLAVSLALVAREMPEPAGPEFTTLVEEVNYGRSVVEALEALRDRVGYPELKFFVAAMSIAHQTGGNMGEILARLSRMLRDRFRLSRRSRALSAEGRFSGIALSALPVILFGLINLVSGSYYADFWSNPWANRILFVSIGLLVAGNLAIYRLVNFRV